MAKREKTAELKTWEDVNKALKQICECEIVTETFNAELQAAINDAKTKYENLIKPYAGTVGTLEKQIEDFVADNADELTGKSKQLTFGVVGFRKATRISYSTKKTDAILESLKKYGMLNCVNVKESINKESLALYADRDIAKVGARRVTEEKFYCETDRTNLK